MDTLEAQALDRVKVLINEINDLACDAEEIKDRLVKLLPKLSDVNTCLTVIRNRSDEKL